MSVWRADFNCSPLLAGAVVAIFLKNYTLELKPMAKGRSRDDPPLPAANYVGRGDCRNLQSAAVDAPLRQNERVRIEVWLPGRYHFITSQLACALYPSQPLYN